MMAHGRQGTESAQARDREAQKATWVSVAVNLAMTLLQILVGWLAHSQSLIAHGLHSFSDLLSDFLVLWASRQGAQPADRTHPYGHARVETAATLALGLSLAAIGGGILWESGWRLQAGGELPVIAWSAMWVAVATVLVKEGLYHYLIAAARRLRSQLLTANAMHTRADAASALVVVVGIGGALAGWDFLDLLAAAVMGFMILRMGVVLAWGAIQELIDTALDDSQVDAILGSLQSAPGVRGLHGLRTRRMAGQALVDVHLQVDPRISVSEAHRIGELARRQVLAEHPEVLDVLVHIDPEDDGTGLSRPDEMPDRAEVLAALAPVLQDGLRLDRLQLHYLAGGVDVDLALLCPPAIELARLAAIEGHARQALSGLRGVREVKVACINAQN
ncbi:cation diffusion facilitator family transporter [Azonexus sp. R2A61]|uniref:cation diffusion facilitator family transporter n=1 Tax=Azonexus sp. R2A61 TaxID=2744443 RepID=UPI001F26447B|nr:cation diffusion facilitator family transporter [Azonexus sp. R2A61]